MVDPKTIIENIHGDAHILAGNVIGPSSASWQDVAGTLACNLRVLADQLDELRSGKQLRRDAGEIGAMLVDDSHVAC